MKKNFLNIATLVSGIFLAVGFIYIILYKTVMNCGAKPFLCDIIGNDILGFIMTNLIIPFSLLFVLIGLFAISIKKRIPEWYFLLLSFCGFLFSFLFHFIYPDGWMFYFLGFLVAAFIFPGIFWAIIALTISIVKYVKSHAKSNIISGVLSLISIIIYAFYFLR